MQRALDDAAKAYKAQVADRQAWNEFFEWLRVSVGLCPEGWHPELGTPIAEVKRIAQDPELLVRLNCPVARGTA